MSDSPGNPPGVPNDPHQHDRGNLNDPASDPGPLVSEETDWRTRALAAEEKVRQLEAQLADIKSTLARAREQLDDSERRAAIDRQLAAAGVIDPETATLLVERALQTMDTPDVPLAIADLQRRKPFLFRAPSAPRASSMSPVTDPPGPTLESLADQARQRGDRKSLLTYLRARRA